MSIDLFEDHSFSGSLEAVDSDGNLLTFTIIHPPKLGAIAVSENSGEFMYTPVSNENGSDAFTFQVSDGIATSEMANVEIWITPVNDIPVGDGSA
ncbi:MAG: hypothetical protein OMM_14406 [Candidatus Magnetoglobus multicellularis str. Araruama]|uniref:Cadherin-like domain-containing protein n=1 Tax=Candidatus Magnetoglobus multicellularis str. Araruama TaxID=890399 RepID=A0A1V1NRY3_9BACT|nr:MAG: hypothetical protein OMM_14406 [Candidatus Magnetoglobus multicellularis str. Araruama]